MIYLDADNPLAAAATEAIRTGDVPALKRLLAEHPELAAARIRENGASRTLLHAATDWPGHFPNVGTVIRTLAEHGADVNAPYEGPHRETPLHWAASCGDLEALDALLDAGADLEAPGAVIAGGTPLDDAVAFAQWEAAHRLIRRGAQFSLWHAAAMGFTDAIKAHFAAAPLPERYPWGVRNAAAPLSSPPDAVTAAFWCACHGGQQRAAEMLLARGAELNWIAPWDGSTPLDAARRRKAEELALWLRSQGAKTARELKNVKS